MRLPNYLVASGKLHLHPISQTHQFRPTLSYLDILSRKNKRSRGGGGSDSDSDDGPPPDPDEIAPVVAPKKEKKAATDAKEVHVTARKTDDQNGPGQGGLSAVRREMLHLMREEEDEKWKDLEFCDVTVRLIYRTLNGSLLMLFQTDQSSTVLGSIFSQSDEALDCGTSISNFIQSIQGL